LLNVGLVTIAFNSGDAAGRMLERARSSAHSVRLHLFLHSSHGHTQAECERLAGSDDVVYYPYGLNRGVSTSWNEGILAAYAEGADVVIVVNDDIEFSEGDIDRLARTARDHAECYIVSCAGYHGRLQARLPSHGYSCFAINPVALEALGCFDENFFPAYCEDQDYAYRARLAGLHEENCPGTAVLHHGSSTIYADAELYRQNALTQRRNIAYYGRKWGGPAGAETFTRPFDRPEFGPRIAPDRRHAPYGRAFDRTDREIFRV
jgi:GT2 family glycosyltransferase